MHAVDLVELCCVCLSLCGCVRALLTLRAALDRAAVLLSMKREIMRLDNVWGVGGGQRPVKHLIKEVQRSLHQHIQDFILRLIDS